MIVMLRTALYSRYHGGSVDAGSLFIYVPIALEDFVIGPCFSM